MMNAEADMSLLPPLLQGTEADEIAMIDYDTFPASKYSSHFTDIDRTIAFSHLCVVNRNI